MLLLLAAAAALAPAACGSTTTSDKAGSPQNPPGETVPGRGGQALPAADDATVVTATRSLEAACPNAATDVSPDPSAAIRSLIAVERLAGPDAIVQYGSGPQAMRMRDYLAREARIAARCGLRGAAAELARAAAGS